MASKEPTHHVKHKNGWEADVYIAVSLQRQLRSRSDDLRQQARASVAIRVRNALGEKFPRFPKSAWLEWSDFTLTELQPVAAIVRAPKPRPSTKKPVVAKHCCDDDNCAVCDQGNHGYCRKGCNLFG